MTGDKPGKRRGVGVVYACLGTAFILNAVFFTVNRLGAQQTAQASPGIAKASLLGGKQAAERFNLRIFKATDRIKLKGHLHSEDDHKTVLGVVKAAFPTSDLTDRIKIEENPTKTTLKVGSINFALKALTYMETGMAIVDGVSVSFDGEVETATAHEEFNKFINSSLPTGVILKSQNIKAPPKSFSWHAKLKDGNISIRGEVLSKENKKLLISRANALFKGMKLNDYIAVSLGASAKKGAPENWEEATLHSLEVLRLLKSGSIEMKGQTISVEGVAVNKGVIIAIDRLASKYPSGFSLASHVRLPSRKDSDATGVLAVPRATASER
jgi:hypothetical protein